MYKSYVMSGRILEIHDDRVLTQQGDVISSYHPRYYMLPEEEAWFEEAPATSAEMQQKAAEARQEAVPDFKGAYSFAPRKRPKPWAMPRFGLYRKSANRA